MKKKETKKIKKNVSELDSIKKNHLIQEREIQTIKVDLDNFDINNDINKLQQEKKMKTSEFIEPNTNNSLANIKSIIHEAVEFQTNKVLSEKLNSITEFDIKIAKDFALGKTDSEIKLLHKISDDKLDFLRGNPAFIAEVQRLVKLQGMGNESTRLSLLSRVGLTLFDSIVNDVDSVNNMSMKDRIDMFIKLNQTIAKQDDNKDKNVKMDLTLILKERGIEQDKIKRDNDGTIFIDSDYPVIDAETGELIGKNADKFRNI